MVRQFAQLSIQLSGSFAGVRKSSHEFAQVRDLRKRTSTGPRERSTIYGSGTDVGGRWRPKANGGGQFLSADQKVASGPAAIRSRRLTAVGPRHQSDRDCRQSQRSAGGCGHPRFCTAPAVSQPGLAAGSRDSCTRRAALSGRGPGRRPPSRRSRGPRSRSYPARAAEPVPRTERCAP